MPSDLYSVQATMNFALSASSKIRRKLVVLNSSKSDRASEEGGGGVEGSCRHAQSELADWLGTETCTHAPDEQLPGIGQAARAGACHEQGLAPYGIGGAQVVLTAQWSVGAPMS